MGNSVGGSDAGTPHSSAAGSSALARSSSFQSIVDAVATPVGSEKRVSCFDREFLVGDRRFERISRIYDPTGKREIGRGAFGWVETCYHVPTGQVRAVKRIAKDGSVKKSVIEHEVAVLRALDHPNIARLYEVFEDKRYVHLCMELCDGGQLEERVCKAGRFSERSACVVMRQLLRAVHYMHTSHHLAHRDIKPENCVFAGDTDCQLEECCVKLIDFGLAEWCAPGEKSLTDCVGTMAYAAPEVWNERYGLECDVWSLGVVLHELLSGRLPTSCKVTFSGAAWCRVSGDAKELLQGMAVKDPDRRWRLQRCLEHRWTKDSAPDAVEGDALHADVVSNMRSYARSSVLRKAALQVIATRMSEKQIRGLEKAFVALDTNNDGVLSMRELQAGISSQRPRHRIVGKQVSLASRDLQQLFKELDTDHNGELQYTEFLAAALGARRYLEHDMAWAAFSKFDRDGSGYITAEELRMVLAHEATGTPRTLTKCLEKNIDRIISAADKDGDGTISFDEFMSMLQEQGADSTPTSRPNGARGHKAAGHETRVSRRNGAIVAGTIGRRPKRAIVAHSMKRKAAAKTR